MSKIINLFAGPSAGKSSVAAALLSELKKRHIKADAPYEFPKVLAWDKNYPAIRDQFYVIGNQHRGIARSWGEVDYIIVDSPILLSLVYKNFYDEKPYYPASFYGKEFDDFIISLHNKYDNVNIFLERDELKFEDEGRYQNLEQSKEIDKRLKEILIKNNINFHTFPTESATQQILELIKIK
jgi:hypothetical protein